MTWWNNSYLFRRNLSLAVLDSIPSNHPVTVELDTDKLYGLNKTRFDLNDVVAVFYDNVNNIWIPLPTTTVFNPANATPIASTIEVQFNTYQPIFAGASKDYFIYYGNKTLTNIPVLPTLSINPWPLKISYLSSKVTYRHPGEDWNAGESTLAGAKAAFIFSGTAVSLIAESGLNDGIASLQLDDRPGINVDFYSNGPEGNVRIYEFTNLEPGYHTLRVVNTGESNSAARNTRIVIDSFEYVGYAVVTDLGEEIKPLNWTTNTGGVT